MAAVLADAGGADHRLIRRFFSFLPLFLCKRKTDNRIPESKIARWQMKKNPKNNHKSKTLASLLATSLGGLGAHRFYLYGKKDVAAWVYFSSAVLYLSVVLTAWSEGALRSSVAALFPLPVYIGFIEALVIGVTLDEKWDARHNIQSGRQTDSRWPLIVVLVGTLAGGFTVFIASMARATDLFYTGGAFG